MNEAEALAVLREAGLLLDAVRWDAGLQRCPTADKPHKKNGAYIAHSDAPASLWWCHWATGQSGTWAAVPEKRLSDKERQTLHERMAAGRRAYEETQRQRQSDAALRAQKLYAAATRPHGLAVWPMKAGAALRAMPPATNWPCISAPTGQNAGYCAFRARAGCKALLFFLTPPLKKLPDILDALDKPPPTRFCIRPAQSRTCWTKL
jgi:hypothetical protein